MRFPLGARWGAGRSAALIAGLLAAAPASAGAPDCPTARARAEIDDVGMAMVAWLNDVTSGAQAGTASTRSGPAGLCPDSPPVDVAEIPPIHAQILAMLLVPEYIAAVPLYDPWGTTYEYRLDVAEPLSADVIAIRSAGANGAYEGTTYDVRFTTGPDDDLVFYDNVWIRDLPRFDPVSRQKVTVRQIQDVGFAILDWYTDIVSCAGGATGSDPRPSHRGTLDMDDYPPITSAELAVVLSVPLLYARCVPEVDGWGTPYDYRVDALVCDGPPVAQVAAIRSLGSDALAESDLYTPGQFPADERHHDIVWADGEMIREPDTSGTALFLDGFESGSLWGYWSCAPGF